MRKREALLRVEELEQENARLRASVTYANDQRVIAGLRRDEAEAKVERGIAAVYLARGQTNSLTQAHAQLTTILDALTEGSNRG